MTEQCQETLRLELERETRTQRRQEILKRLWKLRMEQSMPKRPAADPGGEHPAATRMSGPVGLN